MRHLLPFYLFLCLALGVFAVVLLAVVYRRTRRRPLLWLIAFLGTMGATVLLELISLNAALYGLEASLRPTLARMIAAAPLSAVFLVAGPAYLHEVLDLPWRRRANRVLAAVAVLAAVVGLSPGAIAYRADSGRIEVGTLFHLGQALRLGVPAYGFVVGLAFRARLAQPCSRVWLDRLLVLTALLLPGFAHDLFHLATASGVGRHPVVFLFHPLYFGAISAGVALLALAGLAREAFDALDEEEGQGRADGALAAFRLSERERRAVDLLLDGYGNKQIAAEMGLSVKTVNNLLYALYRRLGVNSRWELIALAAGRAASARRMPESRS